MSLSSLGKIEFHPTSFCDGNGRLFWSEGELCRGIPAKCAEFTRRIFAEGIVDALSAQKLIPRTTLTEAALPDYPIVLRHERVPFVSYAYEWSPSMLRDAALFSIRLLRELAGRGLTLTDVAPWNILFAGCAPIWIDFSSIVDAREEQGRIAHDLESYYLRSLELYTQGHGHLARLLLTDYEHGPISDSFNVVSGRSQGANPSGVVGKIWRRGRAMISPDQLTQMESRMAGFRFAGGKPARHETAPSKIEEFLAARRPASVLFAGDFGDGLAVAVARGGGHVVAIDRDEARVDGVYERARAAGVDILPLVVDLRYPSAGHGVENNVLAPALARLRSETVVALGLIPALVFEQRLRFEQIAGTFERLAEKTLLVDFPEIDNPAIVEHLRDPYFHWFSRENFVQSLRAHFASVRTEARLLICEKNST